MAWSQELPVSVAIVVVCVKYSTLQTALHRQSHRSELPRETTDGAVLSDVCEVRS